MARLISSLDLKDNNPDNLIYNPHWGNLYLWLGEPIRKQTTIMRATRHNPNPVPTILTCNFYDIDEIIALYTTLVETGDIRFKRTRTNWLTYYIWLREVLFCKKDTMTA